MPPEGARGASVDRGILELGSEEEEENEEEEKRDAEPTPTPSRRGTDMASRWQIRPSTRTRTRTTTRAIGAEIQGRKAGQEVRHAKSGKDAKKVQGAAVFATDCLEVSFGGI